MPSKNDAGLRLLIAGECVAVIMGVGYYLIGEYRTQQREKEAAGQRLLSETLRQACLDDLNSARSINLSAPYKIANCLQWGHLSEAEVQSREDYLGVRLR
ncbi:hypothetical protein [Mesorhizobium sp.]|uniref:hypothetical protein n=1 Tax=Mesorhizobium sp. TaxID=1871066 RepID=UPI000FE3490F|nr:hypothetical protein [Mesorhizobium sp.]RWQ14152.1 MAG: hypothetical protein EOR92_27375 [Mesorhizobium sp.]